MLVGTAIAPMHELIAQLTDPLVVVWLVMIAVLARLVWRRRWATVGWFTPPFLLLFIFGCAPTVDILVPGIEATAFVCSPVAGDSKGGDSAFKYEAGESTVVVVLGGGAYASSRDLLGVSLREDGTRILTGLELMRDSKASALVLGGGHPVPGRLTDTPPALLEHWLLSSGLVANTLLITNLGACGNTHDEAMAFRKLELVYQWRRVLLVTSALHIPRAVAVFKKQGITVVPVPCDFKAFGIPYPRFGFSMFPSTDRLQVLGLYLHEKIGWWVYRARGWV